MTAQGNCGAGQLRRNTWSRERGPASLHHRPRRFAGRPL